MAASRLNLAGLALVAMLAVPCGAASIVRGPYLVFPGDNSEMVVVWQTDAPPKTCRIRWGPTPECKQASGMLTGNEEHEGRYQFTHRLTGLSPGEKHHYTVEVDDSTTASAFLAAPSTTEPDLTLYAYGDTRSYPTDHERVCSAILDDVEEAEVARQTLLLHSGDWVTDGDVRTNWDEFFARGQPKTIELQSRIPIMGCRGNHEGDGSLLRRYLPYPYEERGGCYYAFDYGPIHVAVIDQYRSFQTGTPQWKWLREDLATSLKTWKIVVLHEPAWSAGSHENHAETQDHLCPLFESLGVAMVIAGHNHYYARCEVNGIQHVTAGGGGAPLYQPRLKKPKVVAAKMAHHFVRLEIAAAELKLTTIGADGSVIDAVSIAQDSIMHPGPVTLATRIAWLGWRDWLGFAGWPVLLGLAICSILARRQRSIAASAPADVVESGVDDKRKRQSYWRGLVSVVLCLHLLYVNPLFLNPIISPDPGRHLIATTFLPLALAAVFSFVGLFGRRRMGRFASIWALAVCVYLLWSFINGPLQGMHF